MGNSIFSILLERINQQRKLRILILQSLMTQFVIACEGKMTLIATGVSEEHDYLDDYEHDYLNHYEHDYLDDYEFLENKMDFYT